MLSSGRKVGCVIQVLAGQAPSSHRIFTESPLANEAGWINGFSDICAKRHLHEVTGRASFWMTELRWKGTKLGGEERH